MLSNPSVFFFRLSLLFMASVVFDVISRDNGAVVICMGPTDIGQDRLEKLDVLPARAVPTS